MEFWLADNLLLSSSFQGRMKIPVSFLFQWWMMLILLLLGLFFFHFPVSIFQADLRL